MHFAYIRNAGFYVYNADIDATFAVAKRKPEKIQACTGLDLILHPAVLIYDIHIFIISLYAFLQMEITDSTSANQKPQFPRSVVVERCLHGRDRTVTATESKSTIDSVLKFPFEPVELMIDGRVKCNRSMEGGLGQSSKIGRTYRV